jgi:uncharacterized protein Yka (UPF0111/DUF47 family)
MWKEIAEMMNKQFRLEKRRTNIVKCANSVDEIVEFLKNYC